MALEARDCVVVTRWPLDVWHGRAVAVSRHGVRSE